METQTRLSHHNKFISAENITIISVSSDDYLHASLEVAETESIVIFSPKINYYDDLTEFESPSNCTTIYIYIYIYTHTHIRTFIYTISYYIYVYHILLLLLLLLFSLRFFHIRF